MEKKISMLHNVKLMLSQKNKSPSNIQPARSRGRVQSLVFRRKELGVPGLFANFMSDTLCCLA